MYARVVRFTDVDPDHLAGRLAETETREGPPVDIAAKRIQILHDADQRTAVVIQLFETAEDMAAAEPARRDGTGRHAGHARLGRPLRDQGRAEPELNASGAPRSRRPHERPRAAQERALTRFGGVGDHYSSSSDAIVIGAGAETPASWDLQNSPQELELTFAG